MEKDKIVVKACLDDELLDVAELVLYDGNLREDLTRYKSSQAWVKANNDNYSQFFAAYQNDKIVGYGLLKRDPQKFDEYQEHNFHVINNNKNCLHIIKEKARIYFQNRGFVYNPIISKEIVGTTRKDETPKVLPAA